MTITLRQLDDLDEARDLHDQAFEADAWVGDDHTFWVARDPDRRNTVVGFASAIQWSDGTVFLSRCAVVRRMQGCGLHRRMIAHRVLWAYGQGAHAVVTYTTLQNYPSMVNLLAEGFRFDRPKVPWVGRRVHYFRKILENKP